MGTWMQETSLSREKFAATATVSNVSRPQPLLRKQQDLGASSGTLSHPSAVFNFSSHGIFHAQPANEATQASQKTTHPPVLSGRNMKMQLAQLFQVALQTFRQETGVAGYGKKPRIRLKVQITTQHASSNLTMTCIRFFHSQQHACIHACIHKRTCMHTNVHTHSNKNMYMYIDQYQHPTPVPMPIPRHEQISMHFPIDLQRNIHLHECSRTNTYTHV